VELPPDFSEFFALLDANRAEYLVRVTPGDAGSGAA
jgi:hypothetical protein